jgi:hypothetical protein
MSIIGKDLDVILFLKQNIDGQILDSGGNPVTIRTAYPLSLAQVSCLVLRLSSTRSEWLTIGATRQRWYASFDVQAWCRSVGDRFAVAKNFRDKIWSIAKNQLADNYVFMYVEGDTITDDVMLSGTPIYRATMRLLVIYDITS